MCEKSESKVKPMIGRNSFHSYVVSKFSLDFIARKKKLKLFRGLDSKSMTESLTVLAKERIRRDRGRQISEDSDRYLNPPCCSSSVTAMCQILSLIACCNTVIISNHPIRPNDPINVDCYRLLQPQHASSSHPDEWPAQKRCFCLKFIKLKRPSQ